MQPSVGCSLGVGHSGTGGGGLGGCRGARFGFKFGIGLGLGFGIGFRLGFGGGFGWGFGSGGTQTKTYASCHGLTQFRGYNHRSILRVIMHHHIIIAMTIVRLRVLLVYLITFITLIMIHIVWNLNLAACCWMQTHSCPC